MKLHRHEPVISVITVVYNTYLTLEETIKSVLEQNQDLLEYWIIDGGSTDGSIDIIKKYENKLAGWISEPDKGIYDAMNKGINFSKGEWVYFLGADDVLLPNVLDQIVPFLNKRYSLIFGNVIFDNGHIMRSFLNKRTILQNTLHHQAAFYNISVFNNYRYNTSLKIVSDYELNLRIYTLKLPTFYIPIMVSKCATGGASSELINSLRETNKVRGEYLNNKLKNKFYSLLLTLYYSQKQLRFFLYGHRV